MEGLLYWHWFVLGFGLLIAEVMLPGTFCLWLGMAALGTGLIAWLFPALGWSAEVVIYAALSLVAVGLWFRFRPQAKNTPDTGLNQRGKGYVGQVFTLTEAISNGVGKAKVEDGVWLVAGADVPVGSKVRVVAVEGTTLRVEPA